MHSLPRRAAMRELRRFCAAPGAGVVFVRGRRRVGKTWLLQSLTEALKGSGFRILCRKHRRDGMMLREIAAQWGKATGRPTLAALRPDALTWRALFDEIAAYAVEWRSRARKPFVVILDEVQWLSTGFEESAGLVKAAWDEWARTGALRLVACGSSSRFFAEHFGEGSTLRGIQTRASIDVLPFPFAVLRRQVVPAWSTREAALAYMCLGGMPYYWQRLEPEKGFRRAMNDACCTASSIFLDEWREVIATEFRTDAVDSLAQLFPALMASGDGVTQGEVVEQLGVDAPTVARLLEKLVRYGYVQRCAPEPGGGGARAARTTRGSRYVLTDFYLHFYFSVLSPIERQIRSNDRGGLLFPHAVLQGERREHVPMFTGQAFERFVFHHVDVVVRRGEAGPERARLQRRLDLPDVSYEVAWNVLVRGEKGERIVSQIDVLVVHPGERSVRVLECKWKADGAPEDVDDVTRKILPRRLARHARRDYLVVAYEPSPSLLARAAAAGVSVIGLDDFS